jgi:hypothetical protein
MTMRRMKMKMTPEIKRKLKSFSIASNGITVEYTPKVDEDIPSEYVPTFTMRTLSVSEMKKIKNINKEDNAEDIYNEIIRTHLIGWKQMYDISSDDMVEVKYKGDEDGCEKELFYNMLPETLKVILTQNLIALSMA